VKAPDELSRSIPTVHELAAEAPPDSFRQIFELNPDPMLVCDGETRRFLAVNQAAADQYGYSSREFLSLTLEDLLADGSKWGPGGVQRYECGRNPGLASGCFRHRSKTGRIFDVEIRSAILDFRGHDAQLIIVRDITAKRRAEALSSMRYALTRLLAEGSGDVPAKSLRCLCESLEFEAAELWIADASGEYFFVQTFWSRPEWRSLEGTAAGLRLEFGQRESTVAQVADGGDCRWMAAPGSEPGYRDRAEHLARLGLTAGLAFGIRSTGPAYGAVVLLSGRPRPADRQLIHLLVEIGSQFGQYMERARIQQELERADESFHSFFNDAPVPYHEMDCNGVVTRVNEAECRALGLTALQIIGRPVWELVAPDERENSRANVASQIRQRRADPPFERKYRRSDGYDVPFRVYSRLTFDGAGEVSGLRTAMLDLGELRQSRQLLEFQTRLLDQVQDAILVVDADFRITYCNGGAERLFGWTAPEAVGQRYQTVAGTMHDDAEREAIHAQILDRHAWTGEIICTRRDGLRFIAHVSWSVLTDGNGSLRGIVGIHRDLTAPKEIEQRLRATEDRLKLAQSALGLGTWEVDLNSGAVQCSDQVLSLYGISSLADQLVLNERRDPAHPGTNGVSAKAHFLNRGPGERQVCIVQPDGSIRWLHSKATIILDEQDRPCRLIGIDFDVTDLVRAEERLHVLSDALEQSPVSILITDLNGRIEYVNAQFTQSTGYTLEEVKGQEPSVLAPPDTEPETFQEMLDGIQQGEWRGNWRTVRKNGEVYWESGKLRLIRNPAGIPTHRLAVAEDITERLQMEAALKQSEERFRIAAESSGDWICEWDIRSGALRFFGGHQQPDPRSEFRVFGTITEFLDCLHTLDRARVESALKRSLDHGERFNEEFRLVFSTSRIQYWTAQGCPLLDSQGRPHKWVGVCRDVTEQRKVERTNAELAAIVECADSAIVSRDLSGNVVTWNPAAERIYGYTAAEMIGRDPSPVLCANCTEEDQAHLKKLREGGRIQQLETTRVTKEGKVIHVLLTLSPIRNRDGAILGIADITLDITQLKQLETQLAQAQKLESIGHLAAGIAHEINTPIQYIGDNGEFLESAFRELMALAEAQQSAANAVSPANSELEYLKDEIPKAIRQLREGVEQVARIVRAMREFSHPGPVIKMPVDINRAIENMALVSRNEWKYVADLTTDLDPDLPPVPGIAGEFNQVILNLIVNAAHAIADVVKESGARGSIQIRTRCDGRFAEIRVSDTGCGIPVAIQQNIFDPFFTTKPVGKGTGQGLAIVHSVVVQRHRGAIALESEPGRGTTFTIRLPVDESEEQ